MSDYIDSKQGQPHLVNEGFVFRLRKICKDTKYWSCTKRSCNGKLKQIVDGIIHAGNEHNHLPDDAYIELRKCRSNMKKRARTETNSTGYLKVFKKNFLYFL